MHLRTYLFSFGNHTPFRTPTAARVRSSVRGFLPKVYSLCPLIIDKGGAPLFAVYLCQLAYLSQRLI
eukprot:4042478-Amphidinium_carterae.1